MSEKKRRERKMKVESVEYKIFPVSSSIGIRVCTNKVTTDTIALAL